ncbi:ABC transporter substrate-binding protein [Paenibacillus aurantiacus]|uniref:ABC transporter substrate-binding protein n=1 Tax=Paenibacillus aurantiacus TaxID=1936118 RepID=A0ABV5KID0_9BACL
MTVRYRRNDWVIALIVLSLATTACGSTGNVNDGDSINVDKATMDAMQTAEVTPTSVHSVEAKAGDEPVKVVWWHSMDGEPGQAAKQLAANFNAWHPGIRVEAVYQGTFGASLNDMQAAMDANPGPTLIQMDGASSRHLIDSGAVKPVQQFIDAEGYDVSALEPNIRQYATFDGQLNAMPFHISSPILYYNKTLFKEAGLDPEHPPATLAEVAEAVKQLSMGSVTRASFATDSGSLEQLSANPRTEYAHKCNGRTAPGWEPSVNDEAAVPALAWWTTLVDGEHARGLGRKTNDARKAFIAGQFAMTLDSSASLRGIVDGVGGKFEVGTVLLPVQAGTKEDVAVLGAESLWVLNNKPAAEQKAAWEFIKYLVEPKTQAEWHIQTGYFPITTKAYDKQIVKDNMAPYPQFQMVVDQLHQTRTDVPDARHGRGRVPGGSSAGGDDDG